MAILSRFGAAARVLFGKRHERGFNAAQITKSLADWFASASSADAEIRSSLRRLIDRSRDLERNNDYMRGFLIACERNIVGSVRDDLRMDCGEWVSQGRDKSPMWAKDRSAGRMIEDAWREWGKKGTCTVCGRYSWRQVKRLAVRATPRDGTFLLRKVYGASARNRFNFALQVWEVDHLDLDRFGTVQGGNEVRFGIEQTDDGRVVAYWVRARHPGDFSGRGETSSVRVAAAEFYHLFIAERAEQSIGIPWVVSAITRLRQLGAFEEAATIAARVGASQGGFLEKQSGQGSPAAAWSGEVDSGGKGVIDASPLSFQELPEGWKMSQFTPNYPNIETAEFRKAMLRGIGTSLGQSYTTLGNDLESVSFASSRVGLFEEREGWKILQVFFAEELWEPVFSDFLLASITSGAIPLPAGKLAKFDRPVFKQRRWPFVDPAREVQAAKDSIALRLSSRRAFIEEQGGDVEDVFHDNLDDETLAADIGLSLVPPDPQPEAFGDLSLVGDTAPGEDPATKPAKPAAGKKPPPARAATAKEIAAEVVRQTPPAPPAAAPTITVNNQTPAAAPAVVNVTLPEQRHAAPVVNVSVPPQSAPVVNVHPEVRAPDVHVTTPQQAAPVVNVTVPKQSPVERKITIDRDSDGNPIGGRIS